MEQISQSILAIAQSMVANVNQQAGKMIDRTERKDDFRQLMQQQQSKTKQSSDGKSDKTDKPETTEKADGEQGKAAVDGDSAVRAQAVLASMTMVELPPEIVVQTVEAEVAAPIEVAVAAEADAGELIADTAETVVAEEAAPELSEQSAENTVAQEDVVVIDRAPKQVEQVAEETVEITDTKDEVTVNVEQASPEKTIFHEVEAAPIKVAETEVKPEDVQKQVADQLQEAIANGDTHVTLTLNPASLGTVKVELVQSKTGELHISLIAENSQTRGLLEKGMDSLHLMLGSKNTVHIEVERHEQAQQNAWYDGRNGQEQQHQQRQQQRQEERKQQESEDFMQQLRLGLVEL